MIKEITPAVAEPRRTFESGRTRPLSWRKRQLDGLRAFLSQAEPDILTALRDDLGKPEFESWLTEICATRMELDHARKRLRAWSRPRRVSTALPNMPARSRVVAEPLGVVLIIAPWNYPLHLAVAPVASALAAGNAVVLKPSELAPRSAALLAEQLPAYLDPAAVSVVTGGADAARALLAERFDHIFFTGSQRVAKHVMRAAAEYLTPVTLELGGKNPCIVDATADLHQAARRIVWGKFLNAGQTCVAPDYLLVEAKVMRPLTAALASAVREFYGPDPLASPDYQRVLNRGHFDRLVALLDGGRVLFGGGLQPERLLIAPTLLDEVDVRAPVMTEEIFGPILPILPVADLNQALAFTNARPKPLALYLFSRSAAARRRIFEETSSGGVCINDVVMQLVGPSLPFGGVGQSGMGSYHGKAGFDTFSHLKSILIKPTGLQPPLRYPPYNGLRQRLLRRLV